MAPILFGISIGLGSIVFLLGLAALIVVSKRGSPWMGVTVFGGGLVLAALLVLGGKILSALLRVMADVGDKTRQIAQYLKDTSSQESM